MTYTFCLVVPGAMAADQPTVWIALAAEDGAHVEAAAAASAEIERSGPGQGDALVRPWRAFSGGTQPPPRLVIAVGTAALRGLADSGVRAPTLAVLVPEAAYEQWLAQSGVSGHSHSAVLLDQPPARQIAAVRLALPDRLRIGMLFGPDSRRHAAAFERAAAASGVRLVFGQVDEPGELGSMLHRTIDDSDLLLAVADPAIYNNAHIQNILTTAYRRRIPLVGFSPAYVRAGALLALYSTPAQLGAQAGEITRSFLAGRPLPQPQPPRDFVLAINGEVARSLGIALKPEDGAMLAAQLRARERRP